MNLLIAAGILLVIGLVIVVVPGNMIGLIGKIANGIGQVVCLTAVAIGIIGFIQWMF